MNRSKLFACWCALACVVGVLVSLNGCSGVSNSSPTNSPSSLKINHVVVIFQENRTPDNLFHGLPNADIADSGVDSHGNTIPLTEVPLANDYDLNHAHEAFVQMYDGGKMDGADLISIKCWKGKTDCPPPNPQFKYVTTSDVAPYFQLAETYAFGDRMFQTNQGPSFPAHQFIISGTSAPTATSNLFAAENLVYPPSDGKPNAGCIAPLNVTVNLIDPKGHEFAGYPCYEHPTLTDLLDGQKLDWKYYTPAAGSIWTSPNAIRHMCVPDSSQTVCTGSDWTNHVVLQYTQVLTDISSGNLPAVSWVIPSGQSSDHASENDGSGPSWVASVVNAIGGSPYWQDTAIIITWDDWGGWYDHVKPSIYNSYEYGFRVPLIVISPYVKPGYVSHVTHDFGSVLKFIEQNFSLGSLGYADARADDLSDFFDFTQTPLTFKSVVTPLDGSYFLNDKRAPTDPDDD